MLTRLPIRLPEVSGDWAKDGPQFKKAIHDYIKSLNDKGALGIDRDSAGRLYNAVNDFGVVGDGSKDDTPAIQRAFASGEKILFPQRIYKVTAPITMYAGGGFFGVGQNTVFRRFFTGGAMIQFGGAGTTPGLAVHLSGIRIDCDASITPVAGDTGVDMNYNAGAWSQPGTIDDIWIQGQYIGFKWTGGGFGNMSRIVSISNLYDGFYGVNPRGTLNDCLSITNGGAGFKLHVTNNSEHGFKFENCDTFYNADEGFCFTSQDPANPTYDGYSLMMTDCISSTDKDGGIVFKCPYHQLLMSNIHVEGAGNQTVKNTSAKGIVLYADSDQVLMSNVLSYQNQGNGVEIGAVDAVSISGITCVQNGMGATGAANQIGLSIANGATFVNITGFNRAPTGAGTQLSDVTVGTTVTGSLLSVPYSGLTITNNSPTTFVAGSTGSGKFVLDTSPTLVTPVLGSATATTINKWTFTTPATGVTMTILDNKTFTVNKTLTLDGTDGTTHTFPATTSTLARTDAAQTFAGVQTFSGNVTVSGSTVPANGMYLPAANQLGWGINSAVKMRLDANGLAIGAAPLAGADYYALSAGTTARLRFGNTSNASAMDLVQVATDMYVYNLLNGSTFLGVNNATVITLNGTSTTFAGAARSASATGGVGYSSGAGGTQTQATSKSTTVVLNTVCGEITMHNATLNANTTVSFTLTNSAVAATDLLHCVHVSGGTVGSYLIHGRGTGAGSATITVRNITAGNLGEAIVIGFAVIKKVNA